LGAHGQEEGNKTAKTGIVGTQTKGMRRQIGAAQWVGRGTKSGAEKVGMSNQKDDGWETRKSKFKELTKKNLNAE